MSHFIIYDPATKEISIWGSAADIAEVVAPVGLTLLETPGPISRHTHYVNEGAVVAYTLEKAAVKQVQPFDGAVWSNTTLSWVDTRTITVGRTAADKRINAARLAANQSSFTFAGKQIACDPLSRSDIDAVNGFLSRTGTLPAGWPGAWKAVDNTFVAIATAADWDALYAAMVARGMLHFAYSQSLKAQGVAAGTLPQLDAIVWANPG